MAIYRYWRIAGICTADGGPLELSEARIYEAGVPADADATLSLTIAPTTGVLSYLNDGLATDRVLWLSGHYKPGFALVWDFGAGQGVEFAQLLLGSGSAAGSFPQALTLQHSGNGVDWTTYREYGAITFPGAYSTSAIPSAEGDALFDKVKLLVHGDGVSGTTLVEDVCGHPITSVGDVRISTDQTKTGGSVIDFYGTGGRLVIPSSPDFDLGTVYTVEGWIYPRTITHNFGIFHRGFYSASSSLWGGLAFSTRWLGDALRVYFYATQNSDEQYVDIPNAFAAMAWRHLRITRNGSVGYVWINDILAGTKTGLSTPAPSSEPLKLGVWDYSAGAEYFDGYIQDLRITVGVARDSGSGTPPVTRLPGPIDPGLPMGAMSPRAVQLPGLQQFLPAVALSAGSADGHLREQTFRDVYHGGRGVIRSTVKRKNTPADTPLRRRVDLIDERSRLTIRSTWSDAITGNYEFLGVREDLAYTVIGYDHVHNYRAVVADNLALANGGVELMP